MVVVNTEIVVFGDVALHSLVQRYQTLEELVITTFRTE
jgi:hypothetical protein